MIFVNRKLYTLGMFLSCFFLTMLLVKFVATPAMGNPLSSCWGLIFFLSLSTFCWFIRQILLNGFKHYTSYPYYFGIILVLPILFILVLSIDKHINANKYSADSIFTATVISVDESIKHLGYRVVKLSVLSEYKPVDRYFVSNTGVLYPKDCGLEFKPGENYLVYLVKNMRFISIACKASRHINGVDIPEEEAYKLLEE